MITILCSSVALGVYTPAVLLREELSGLYEADLEVLESLYPPETRLKLTENKKVFSTRFEVAKLGHRMIKDITPNLDPQLVTRLLGKWAEQNRRVFMVFSGFWMPIIEEYAKSYRNDVHVELIHMDAVISPSWKLYFHNIRNDLFTVNDVWFFDGAAKRVNYSISMGHTAPKDYKERDNRLVIHGGGWGMGTYKETAAELNRSLDLNIVIHELADDQAYGANHRYYMVKPGWSPWMKNEANEYTLPPFGEVIHHSFHEDTGVKHSFYQLICNSKAIISKPGGGTLLDSLESCTPVIFLEPLGEHETNNAQLWEQLGFGIGYEKWRKLGCPSGMLETFSGNLQSYKSQVHNYGRCFDETAANIRSAGPGFL
ncbi:hypothetical protein MHH28_00880 [Paenibacillus sp. FSL K6-1217]|uniref:hypothetical protein n=1 Tax=Paenibacillus sp. FSL K6-1217 TaxID=2921466 RepID=UPI0032441C1A